MYFYETSNNGAQKNASAQICPRQHEQILCFEILDYCKVLAANFDVSQIHLYSGMVIGSFSIHFAVLV